MKNKNIKSKSKKSSSRYKNNIFLNRPNRGQITIFIIIGLMLVVLIAIIFVARSPPKVDINDEKSPHAFVESCTKQAVEEALKKILQNGGDLEPKLSVMYKNYNRSYLCYNNLDYKACINQRPRLIEHIEGEINSYIKPKIEECFKSLKDELQSKRYSIQMGDQKVSTTLSPGQINVMINRKFTMIRGEEKSREFNTFKIQIVHPMYNIADVSSQIVNQEAQYCNFDSLGYMIMYPQFDITRFKTGDSDTIYTVMDRYSNQEMTFAIRSCTMPPGI